MPTSRTAIAFVAAAALLAGCTTVAAREDAAVTEVRLGPASVGGELVVPPNAYQPPAVVLLAGAGPNDRDETSGAIKPLRDIAYGLARDGVASLRFDKRTLSRSPVAAGFTTRDEYVADALAAFEVLRTSGRVDPSRIFLLGHSFGGTMAPRIATAEPRFAGLILLAPPSRSLPETLRKQFRYLASLGGALGASAWAQLPAADALVREADDPRLQRNQPIASSVARDAIAPGLTGAYFLDLRGYNAPVAAAALRKPVLLVHPLRDFLVDDEDEARWRAAFVGSPALQVLTYPRANHLLVNGTGPSTPDEYQRPGHVSTAAIDDIADWIKGV